MADINHKFPIQASIQKVVDGFTTPKGLDGWWSKNSSGQPQMGTEYELDFGPGYVWKAEVTKCTTNFEFELTMISADVDWINTKVGCILDGNDEKTQVHFYHRGWPNSNNHYHTSNYCWAMYLRILKRNLEFGEEVPYERRLDV